MARFKNAMTGREEEWPFECEPPTADVWGCELFTMKVPLAENDFAQLVDSKTVEPLSLIAPAPIGVVRKVDGGYCWVELGCSYKTTRDVYMARRQALLIELGAIEEYLGLPRSVVPKHAKR